MHMAMTINIEEFRNFCLSLGEVTEKMPFGKFARRYDSILAFYVLGHMFCFIDIDNFNFVDICSTPEETEEIKASYSSVSKPLNPTLRHWIQLDLFGDIPLSKILYMVKRSYIIIHTKYTTKGNRSNRLQKL